MSAQAQLEREELFRRELVEELRRVEVMVRQAPSLEKKAYYFSAAYGITNRTYRYSFSKDVLMADLMLNGVYHMIMERIAALKSGDQNVIPDDLFFEKICDGLRDLANCFESEESIFDPLKDIVTAGFSLTGAGNYLKEKGLLEL
jgi:hypothetical protein